MRKACFLMLLSLYILGCGENNELEPAPKVLSVTVQDGDSILPNTIIIVTFSKEMYPESVVITLNGIPVSVDHNNNKEFAFILYKEGEVELTIAGRDKHGQALDPPYKPIKFTVLPLIRLPLRLLMLSAIL